MAIHIRPHRDPRWVMMIWFLSMLAAGCQPGTKRVEPMPAAIGLNEIVSRYNANVAAVPGFKADLKEWEVRYRSESGRDIHHKDIGGYVFYRPAGAGSAFGWCYLEARTLLDRELVLGCNQSEYWMYVKRAGLAQWGKHEYLGKSCVDTMGLNPQQFLLLAGLQPIGVVSDPNVAAPVLKVQPEQYIIESIARDAAGPWVQYEVALDRRTIEPTAIYIYDRSGHRRIESRLSRFEPIGEPAPNTPPGAGVMSPIPGRIAREVALSTPQGDIQFRIELSNLKVGKKDRPELFERPKKFAGVDDYQQIDKACEGQP